MTVAHPDRAPAPHDLWWAWNLDPVLLTVLVLLGWTYWTGRAGHRQGTVGRARDQWFVAGLATLAVALVSPLDALSDALASAHMVQHLLLTLGAAPLLALSAPVPVLLRGTPLALRRGVARWRGRLRLTRSRTRALRHPATAWSLHVGTLWFWHAARPYGAALDHELVHVLEHASFLLTGVLFWGVVIDSRRRGRMSPGFGVLFLFAAAMQSVFLSALLTFAGTPWYDGYAATTAAWDLEPLADQHLAGVIMWIPGGVVYIASALVLLVAWIGQSETAEA